MIDLDYYKIIASDESEMSQKAHEFKITLRDLITDVERELSSQLEPQVGKILISELRKHYLVEIDIDTGEPKADMKTLMELWEKVNNYLEIKTIGKT